MTGKEGCGLPLSEKKLGGEVDRYFEECAQSGAPPTPSGLALALGVRTSVLMGENLTDVQKKVIDRAMQRIEAGTMEMMLTRGGVKGMESVLERVEETEDAKRAKAELRGMSDEEIREKLRRLAVRIERVLGK